MVFHILPVPFTSIFTDWRLRCIFAYVNLEVFNLFSREHVGSKCNYMFCSCLKLGPIFEGVCIEVAAEKCDNFNVLKMD